MLLKVQSVKHMLLCGENAVHGSDSDENAAIEGAFILQEESSLIFG
jgi:nucleoside diphosphate kinase